MAVKLTANYSKRLGLPGYSSHQFSVSVETELVNIDSVAEEARRLYALLQANVDGQIVQTGFVPPADYGMEAPPNTANAALPANSNLVPATVPAANSGPAPGAYGPASVPPAAGFPGNGNGTAQGATPLDGHWKCSDKQRDFILKLVAENRLDKQSVENLALERFGKGVRMLDKLEASGLIDELLETSGNRNRGNGRGNRRNAYAANRKGGAR
jgi:hypothetical protein